MSLTKISRMVEHHHSSYVSQYKDHIYVRYIMVMYKKLRDFLIRCTKVLKAIFKRETASYTVGSTVLIYDLKLPVMESDNDYNALICV